MEIHAIVAWGKNKEIGGKNKLLWHISEDLKNFKKLTTGHAILMGRKTFESIGRPLPNRVNLVLTRSIDQQFQGCQVVGSPQEALARARDMGCQKLFVIGGAQIYEQFLDICDVFHISVVEASFPEADAFFPAIDESLFKRQTIKSFSAKDGCPAWSYQIWQKS